MDARTEPRGRSGRCVRCARPDDASAAPVPDDAAAAAAAAATAEAAAAAGAGRWTLSVDGMVITPAAADAEAAGWSSSAGGLRSPVLTPELAAARAAPDSATLALVYGFRALWRPVSSTSLRAWVNSSQLS